MGVSLFHSVVAFDVGKSQNMADTRQHDCGGHVPSTPPVHLGDK